MHRIAALVCASLWMSTVASAQLYTEGRVGAAFMPNEDAEFYGLDRSPVWPAMLTFGNGAVGGAAIGWDFDFGLRTELSLMGQGNQVEELKLLGYLQGTDLSTSWECNLTSETYGRVQSPSTVCYLDTANVASFTTMVDALYDIELGKSPIVPYVGAGIGVQYSWVTPGTGESGFPFSGSFTTFAWEVGGGFSYRIGEKVEITVNYRYLKPTGVHSFVVYSPLNLELYRLTTEFSSHNVTGGLRYTFDLFGDGS
jgi:opacity protein-like surface antigen